MLSLNTHYPMEKLYVTSELAKFLSLKEDTKYSKSEIFKIIKKKKIEPKNVQTHFPEYKMCYCGNCPINKADLTKFIESNCLIKNHIPDSFCYGYDEKPVTVSLLEFDV